MSVITYVNHYTCVKSHLRRDFYRNSIDFYTGHYREVGSSVVECLTRDRRAAGLSLTGVTALWSLSKTHLS